MLAKYISETEIQSIRFSINDNGEHRLATDEELIELGYKEVVFTDEETDGQNYDCKYIDGEVITQTWVLSETQPSADVIRRRNYELYKCIEYKGSLITVDQANRLVMQYECEGIDMSELKTLIHERKQVVREQFKEVENETNSN